MNYQYYGLVRVWNEKKQKWEWIARPPILKKSKR